jgi:succinate dehydrogenase / fumarate reductase flavoprotein subunit
MQGLSDGYFVLPYTIQNYLSKDIKVTRMSSDLPEYNNTLNEVKERLNKLMSIKGTKSVDHFHKKLGHIMWEYVGMGRTKAGLEMAVILIRDLKKEFWSDLRIPGDINGVNTELEKATRVADFIELGELAALDALQREESCGGHFREEHQTPEGEALRNDNDFMFVGAWEYKGEDKSPELHKEELKYEAIEVKQRDYK